MAGILAGSGVDLYPGAEQHLRLATVDAVCTHCPTVWFRLPANLRAMVDEEDEPVTDVMPMHALATDSDGMGIDVLLHIVDGYLNELEVYRYDGLPLKNLPDVPAFKLAPTRVYDLGEGPHGGEVDRAEH